MRILCHLTDTSVYGYESNSHGSELHTIAAVSKSFCHHNHCSSLKFGRKSQRSNATLPNQLNTGVNTAIYDSMLSYCNTVILAVVAPRMLIATKTNLFYKF